MRIAIPLYPRFTALDAVGPYTVFRATALALSGQAKFDLAGNRMIIDYAGATPAAMSEMANAAARTSGWRCR